ncbi:uncharacterized protein TRIREDRAFT_53499 [Trichoderma reesei QM6a]|uniref:Predicted protein n=1 Tax=Hypocrea jecorina (strain QM6a) TaxID=431241 RepID=G0R977_HYPJQ|nr:uncharacterized protein TRIREDRAFT_53499 [Trichoderma reesei QM6a]EGR52653.1 predicted protein [Trichoderma reesei QM6a]
MESVQDEDENDAQDRNKDEAQNGVKDEQVTARERVQVEPVVSERMLADMEAEKRQYLGTSLRWAPLEERLFEILFLRQEIPLLPSYWEEYFLPFPMPEACYCWRKDMNPVVYAHANNTCVATVALARLIDLTADILTTCQSGLRSKAPQMIKKSLEKFLNWAAEDGGYRHLEYLPNIIVEIVDRQREDMPQTAAFVEMRMRDLARKHRQKLAIKPEKEEGELIGRRSVIKPEYHGETSVIESDADEPMTPESNDPAGGPVNVKQEDDDEGEEIRVAIKRELHSESDDDIAMADIPLASSSAANSSSLPTLYRRQPPVIFGFFIVGAEVMLLTADSSKDEAAMNLSLQVTLNFEDRSLSIWNALTVAIVVCLARDDMMQRMDDFEEARVVEESDPDA